MSKKITTIDLDALRSEFPGATDARLAVIAEFRGRKLPAVVKRTGEAIMRHTMALEFSALPNVSGDPRIITVAINTVASGCGVGGEVTWTDGKFSGAWFNAGGATGDVIVRSAADFVKRLEKAMAGRVSVETVDAPATDTTDTTDNTTDAQDTPDTQDVSSLVDFDTAWELGRREQYWRLCAETAGVDSSDPVALAAWMEEERARIVAGAQERAQTVKDTPPTPAAPVKGSTDRVERALAAAAAKVAARGADPVDDSEEAAQDARDRVDAQLAVLASVSEPTPALPTSGAVPVEDVPAVVRVVRDVPTPGDLAIALAVRLETSHKHFSALMAAPATLGNRQVRTRVANAITKELGELRIIAADMDGTDRFKIAEVSREITQLGEWVFEILRAYRFLLINNSHKITTARVKNVKAKIRKRAEHVQSPEFRAQLTARLIAERTSADAV